MNTSSWRSGLAFKLEANEARHVAIVLPELAEVFRSGLLRRFVFILWRDDSKVFEPGRNKGRRERRVEIKSK